MAQLPYLMYDHKPPMSSQKFKELALSLLNRSDRVLFKNLAKKYEANIEDAAFDMPSKKTGCAFIDNWLEWERTLRINIARHRFLHLNDDEGKTPVSESVEFPELVEPSDAHDAAAFAFAQDGSPLEGEILLDKARWNAIDMLTGNDYFHENNVYAYYLKLLLLERRQLFDVEKGFSEYKSIYAEILESPHNGQNSQGEDK